MIILDTNVVSEVMKQRPSKAVVAWLDEQSAETVYLTSVSLAELSFGIESLPESKRKAAFADGLETLVKDVFASRILPFDYGAALTYGSLLAKAKRQGKVVSTADGQIAAIAKLHGFIIASRDTKPFAAVGVPVINPW